MAGSSSSAGMSCFQCQQSCSSSPDDDEDAHFRKAWRLRSGDYARLCPRCASAYEEGRFCETFHSNDDGWRDCESCGKLVHCGCIVSFNTHFLLDFGGVICMECSRCNFLLARKRCLSLEPEIRAGEPHRGFSGKASAEVSRNPKATLTPLFEKILSASDADCRLSRLIIPKRCAEAYFPDISGSHGLRLKIHDTEGNEWEFNYRYWLNGGSKIYVLEGLRDYMVSKKWQPGDTVMFYRGEPGGKIVMGSKKTSASPQLPSAKVKG